MSSSPVIIVTGANRGVGLGILRTLSSSGTPYVLYATSRSGTSELDGISSSSSSKINYVALDISDPSSIKSFASNVEKAHGKGGVDVLINNAGTNEDIKPGYGKEPAQRTMKTNFWGTKLMCDSFLPLLRPQSGRIVNVASVACHLNNYPSSIVDKFRSTAAESTSSVIDFANEYEALLADGKEISAGWPKRAYNVSKAFMTAYTKALAKEQKSQYLINACCPGWVNTDMGNLIGKAPKSLEDGAKIPVRLAVQDIEGTTGEFWENPGVTDTGYGQPSKW